jgi:hypothetical protein
VELMGKEKGYNSSHVYCQAKGWSKKSYENFLNDLEKVPHFRARHGASLKDLNPDTTSVSKAKCFPVS